ncbi:MAG: PAS domain S-box protein [Candidatus Saccharicenans sp.]
MESHIQTQGDNSPKKRILLVEDDALIALMESELLESGGYEVLVAHSGQKALEIFESGQPIDLVLMDIDLGPGMDGAETARRILAKKDLPVVFISSHTEPEILAKTEAITSYGYIVKGSSDTAFFASLNMAFRLYAAHQELLKKARELEDLADNLSSTVKKLLKMQEELKIREQKLKETSEHLEATLNSLPDLMFELDEQGTYLDVRAPNPHLLVRPRDELIGRKISDFLPKEVADSLIYALQEAAEKGLAEMNYSLELPSGIHYFEASIARKGENRPGQNTFVALVRDITDSIEAQLSQQKSEIRFSRLFHSMSEGVAIHRLIFDQQREPVDYEIIEVNEAYSRHTGLSRDQTVGQKVSNLFGPGEVPYLELFSQVVLEGRRESFETYFPPLNRHFKITAFPLGENMFATVFEDITEKRKTEQALREREERYRLIFDNAPIGILQFDDRGTITECNDEFVRIIGSSREVLIGFNILERAGDDKVKEAIREALSGRIGYYEGIYHSVTANKSTPAQGFFAGIFDRYGNFVSGIGIFEDVSGRYQAEEARRDSEARLRAIFDSSIHSFIFLDTEGRIQAFNQIADKRMIEVLGQHLEVGKMLVDLLPQKFKATFPETLSRALSGEYVRVEREIARSDGSLLFYEFYLTPVYSPERNIIGVFFSAEDITEIKEAELALRQSEKRFRTIFEYSGTVMLLIDPEDGKIIDANYRAEEFYGYSREKLRQMNIKEINTLPPDIVQQRMDEAKQRAVNYFIFPHRLASGEIKEVEVHSHPIEFGEKKYLLSIILDISPRVQLERQLKKALEEKQQILRELQHRVKNSFALIHSLINLELNRLKDKTTRAPLESFKSRINSLSKLYDLLSLGEKYQQISLDLFLKEICKSILNSYTSSAKKIELKLDLKQVSLEVKSAIAIGLMANEILTNALKHAFPERTSGRVEVKLHKEGNQLFLEIADDGIGLPRGQGIFSSEGIGREIIESLSEQLEAKMEIESQPAQGTKFKFSIPVKSSQN